MFQSLTDKVCGLHFLPTDFNEEKQAFIQNLGYRSYKTLKNDSIPSINLPFIPVETHNHSKHVQFFEKPLNMIAEKHTLMNADVTSQIR